MTLIHIQANYLPNHRKFKVVVKASGRRRFSEHMTISKFMRMAKEQSKPLKVGGITINLSGEGADVAEQQIQDYLKQVADSYLQYKTQQN
jgi:hypothetical protein